MHFLLQYVIDKSCYISFILFISGTHPIPPPAIYVIPLRNSTSDSKLLRVTHQAWDKIPETNCQNKKQLSKNYSSYISNQTTGRKCCQCSRQHRIGVNVPKCCAFGIAEEHLLEHLFDDIVFDSNSCSCSLNTLAEILPKLTNQNPATGSSCLPGFKE